MHCFLALFIHSNFVFSLTVVNGVRHINSTFIFYIGNCGFKLDSVCFLSKTLWTQSDGLSYILELHPKMPTRMSSPEIEVFSFEKTKKYDKYSRYLYAFYR